MSFVPNDSAPASAAPPGPAQSNSALSMFRSFGARTSTFLKDATAKTAETVKGGTRGISSTSLRGLGASAGEQMQRLGKTAAEGGAYVWKTTRSTTDAMMGRFTDAGASVAVQSAREAKEQPCPRVLLLCCTAVCSGALASEGLFTTDAQPDVAQHLLSELSDAHFGRLLPAGATPQLITTVVKRWLCSLPEPLLTFKLVPALTCADTPRDALKIVLRELPIVNHNAVLVLLETCHRIASNAAINDTDAAALAAALAPCLLWRAAEGGAAKDGAGHAAVALPCAGEPLNEEETAVFVDMLTYMINNYRSF